jgi:hypothetical protein
VSNPLNPPGERKRKTQPLLGTRYVFKNPPPLFFLFFQKKNRKYNIIPRLPRRGTRFF